QLRSLSVPNYRRCIFLSSTPRNGAVSELSKHLVLHRRPLDLGLDFGRCGTVVEQSHLYLVLHSKLVLGQTSLDKFCIHLHPLQLLKALQSDIRILHDIGDPTSRTPHLRSGLGNIIGQVANTPSETGVCDAFHCAQAHSTVGANFRHPLKLPPQPGT
ncbi:hypothetical protein BDM02DRAFT_3173699, partial [Thelephora ganbajun]